MFSRRSGWSQVPNRYAAQLEAARARGAALIDLTVSNPTEVGLRYPAARIATALADPRASHHAPEPLGLRSAREAVAGYYAARGIRVDPDQVVLTASTSEAYAFLFKLLADPGDAVLMPRPGYPLLDVLAELEPVELRPYALAYDGTWYVELESLAAAAPGARALTLVSPHNPTGHTVDEAERDALCALATKHGLALICDEVFGDYAPAPFRSFADEERVLTFTLSGLSKVAGLPQLKLAWMVVSGPEALRREALARLELIADAFLSVATPVQLALPVLLESAAEVQDQLRARSAANRAALKAARPADAPWDVLRGEAGWYAVVSISRARSQDAWCEALLQAGVVVQPGYLFDLERPHALVLSLLPEPSHFAEGVRRLAEVLAG